MPWREDGSGINRYADAAALEAARQANAAQVASPHHRGAALLLAGTQVARGRLTAARTHLVGLLGRDEMDGPYRRVRSRWLLAEGDDRGAIEAVLGHLDDLPEPEAMAERLRLAPLLLLAGRSDDARSCYEAVRTWRSDWAEPPLGLARCAAAENDWSAVEGLTKAAIELGAGREARELLKAALAG